MQKPTISQLKNLSNNDSWPEFTDVREPELSDEQVIPSVVFDLFIRPEINYFAGHFSEQAVLPGVVQVHWAAKLGLLWIKGNSLSNDQLESPVQLKKVKFNNPVLPDYKLSLQLRYRVEKQEIGFQYTNSQLTFSSGLISFSELS